MEWQNPMKYKRSSVSVGMPYSQGGYSGNYSNPQQQRAQFYNNRHALLPPSSNVNNSGLSAGVTSIMDRQSYYFSPFPLYCSDWTYLNSGDVDCIALSSYKEGFSNKIQVIHGIGYGKEATGGNNDELDDEAMGSPMLNAYQDDVIEGFDFHRVAEASVDYPVTNLQWDPAMLKMSNGVSERLAASLEVLRLYKVDHDIIDKSNDYKLTQTHTLINNTTTASSSTSSSSQSNVTGVHGANSDEVNTFPPVTSFDWNKIDSNIIITSSVDTTCTVWDLNRSLGVHEPSMTDPAHATDTATVKTQLIAHDSEVFDVKFIHKSTNVFASVGNDGSMRVFDLRSLEHSTIIYEPPLGLVPSTQISTPHHNSRALLKLSASNVDQHYLATIGVNSNQVIIIDMRMPGLPVAALDGSLGGVNTTAINSILWHPSSNYILTGGDDCQALVWDCNNLGHLPTPKTTTTTGGSLSPDVTSIIESPVLAYDDDLEINNVCWRRNYGDWMGVVSGKGFQAVLM